MKFGFFHDSPIILDNGKHYSRTLQSNIWDRYIQESDELIVSTRVVRTAHGSAGSSEHERVSFRPIASYQSPLSLLLAGPKVIKEIGAALADVDGAIVRLPSVVGWLTCFLARLSGKPILIEVVGCSWDAYWHHSGLGRLMAPIGYLATRFSVKDAPFVVYVTKSFLQKRYPTKGRSVSISNVNIKPDVCNLNERLAKIESDSHYRHASITVGSIGRIDLPYKGHASAIQAISLLRDRGIELKYEIVGPGDTTALEQLISELGLDSQITLVGSLSSADLHTWLDSVDIYLQPSLTEGLPRSVVEAMSHGAPVVLSDVGGHPELVSVEYLYKAGDPEELADKIEEVLNTNLAVQASRNFEESKRFDRDELQNIRSKFLSRFKESIV
ncbi:glycosyltransferase [Corynebacterium sp. H128]|uniref:glycosyltransferase n=1 Tax=Corynebacterium sp. H128 TaxID=3133427 RepID=UPI0030B78FE4